MRACSRGSLHFSFAIDVLQIYKRDIPMKLRRKGRLTEEKRRIYKGERAQTNVKREEGKVSKKVG